MEKMRLDRFLTLTGVCSRSRCRELIRMGRIAVNGITAKKPDEKILPGKDKVTADGKEIFYETFVYWMLNKPSGILTATEDKKRKTVLDLIPDKRTDLFPVGRLDLDTEGLLIITNDGELAHRLLSPKYHVDKNYFVETEVPIPQNAEKLFADGIDLGDFTSMPADFSRISEKSGIITVREGKFHQVKRMFEAAGAPVSYLKRLSMGPVKLDEALKAGECRPLSGEEIEALRKTAGKQKAGETSRQEEWEPFEEGPETLKEAAGKQKAGETSRQEEWESFEEDSEALKETAEKQKNGEAFKPKECGLPEEDAEILKETAGKQRNGEA